MLQRCLPFLRRSAVPALLGSLLTASSPAHAEDAALAKRLLRQAEKLCAEDQPEPAFDLYRRSLEAKPLATTHLAYGECLRKAGKWDRALEQFRSYVQLSRRKRDREQGEMLIRLCEEELQREREAARPTTVPAEQAHAVEQPPDLRPKAPAPPPPPKPSRRRLSQAYFWTGVGLTVGLLAAGTATGVLALQKADRFNDLGTPAAELRGLKDTGEMLTNTSTAMFAVGAAAAVGTTVLFFFTKFRRVDTVSAAPLPGGAALVVGGRL